MTRNLLFITLLFGLGIQAVNMAYSGLRLLSIIPLLFLFGWYFSHRFKLLWFIDIIFIANIGLLAWISFFSIAQWTLFISAACILISWDLTHFQKLLSKSNPKNNLKEVEARHLWKLLLISLISFVITIGAMFIRIRVSFLQSIILLIIAFTALLQLIRWLLQQNKSSRYSTTSVQKKN